VSTAICKVRKPAHLIPAGFSKHTMATTTYFDQKSIFLSSYPFKAARKEPKKKNSSPSPTHSMMVGERPRIFVSFTNPVGHGSQNTNQEIQLKLNQTTYPLVAENPKANIQKRNLNYSLLPMPFCGQSIPRCGVEQSRRCSPLFLFKLFSFRWRSGHGVAQATPFSFLFLF
jgi:hypothetical protein